MKTRKQKWMMGCGGLLFAAVVITVVIIFFTPLQVLPYLFYLNVTQHHRLNKAIEKNLPEIAKACISLSQIPRTNDWFISVRQDDPRIPEVIKRIKCRRLSVMQEFVQIEMHGGFNHFGIRVHQDQSNSNVWQVRRYWEGGHKLLMTITNIQEASSQSVDGMR